MRSSLLHDNKHQVTHVADLLFSEGPTLRCIQYGSFLVNLFKSSWVFHVLPFCDEWIQVKVTGTLTLSYNDHKSNNRRVCEPQNYVLLTRFEEQQPLLSTSPELELTCSAHYYTSELQNDTVLLYAAIIDK